MIDTIEVKRLADMGILDAALQAEYLIALQDRLTNPQRLTTVWGATFLALKKEDKLSAIVQTAMDLLECGHGALMLIGHEALVLSGNKPPEALIKRDLNETYCQHVVDNQPFLVEDATRNNLVCKVQSTVEDHVRSYLGVPVVVGKYVVGSLCVYDMEPRQWIAAEVRVMASLAITVTEMLRT